MAQALGVQAIKNYRILLRAVSSTALLRDHQLIMTWETPEGIVTTTMRTRYVGDDKNIRGDLMVVVDLAAANIEKAVEISNKGREMAMLVSVAVNACISPLEPELLIETTKGATTRDFFQRFVPADQLSFADRLIPMDEVMAFIEACSASTERDRLIRAMGQYCQGLDVWENGYELPALSHMFMGVEAIKTARWRVEAQRLGVEPVDLAKTWGFTDDGRMKVEQYLDSEARRRLVFENDTVHHKMAKKVSDDFEHGFANAGNLYEPARKSLVATAYYLRKSIFTVAALDKKNLHALMVPPYSKPRGPAGIEQHVKGAISDPDLLLDCEGAVYPSLYWETNFQVTANEDGSLTYDITPNMKFHATGNQSLVLAQYTSLYKGTFDPPPANDLQINAVDVEQDDAT